MTTSGAFASLAHSRAEHDARLAAYCQPASVLWHPASGIPSARPLHPACQGMALATAVGIALAFLSSRPASCPPSTSRVPALILSRRLRRLRAQSDYMANSGSIVPPSKCSVRPAASLSDRPGTVRLGMWSYSRIVRSATGRTPGGEHSAARARTTSAAAMPPKP